MEKNKKRPGSPGYKEYLREKWTPEKIQQMYDELKDKYPSQAAAVKKIAEERGITLKD